MNLSFCIIQKVFTFFTFCITNKMKKYKRAAVGQKWKFKIKNFSSKCNIHFTILFPVLTLHTQGKSFLRFDRQSSLPATCLYHKLFLFSKFKFVIVIAFWPAFSWEFFGSICILKWGFKLKIWFMIQSHSVIFKGSMYSITWE